MRHTRLRVLLVLGAAAVALTTLGCFKANLEVDLKPDLAMNIAAEMRMPSEFMTEEMSPADVADLDQVTVEQIDGMHVIRGTRRLGPGETLAAEETDRGMEIMRQKVARRLSTRYIFVAEFAGNPMPTEEGPVAADDEQAFDPTQLTGLMSGFFSGFEFGVNVHMPGRLLSTSGTDAGGGTASFVLGLDDMMTEEPTRLTAMSSLPNYAHLGRLADQMILAGGDAATVGQLPAYLDAGLLPDPPLEISREYKLAPEDYLLLTTIIATLDRQLPTGMTEAIVKRLGLNADDVRPEQIRAAAAAVAGKDLQGLAIDSIVKAIK